MGWLYELLANIFAVLSPTLHKYGMPNVYMVDPILMFVVIPFVHLMNDENTKGIISDENWYQGLRHMMGMYNESPQMPTIPQAKIKTQSKSLGSSHVISKTDENDTTCHQKISIRRCNSAPTLWCSEVSISLKKSYHLQNNNSLPNLMSP